MSIKSQALRTMRQVPAGPAPRRRHPPIPRVDLSLVVTPVSARIPLCFSAALTASDHLRA